MSLSLNKQDLLRKIIDVKYSNKKIKSIKQNNQSTMRAVIEIRLYRNPQGSDHLFFHPSPVCYMHSESQVAMHLKILENQRRNNINVLYKVTMFGGRSQYVFLWYNTLKKRDVTSVMAPRYNHYLLKLLAGLQGKPVTDMSNIRYGYHGSTCDYCYAQLDDVPWQTYGDEDDDDNDDNDDGGGGGDVTTVQSNPLPESKQTNNNDDQKSNQKNNDILWESMMPFSFEYDNPVIERVSDKCVCCRDVSIYYEFDLPNVSDQFFIL